MLEFILALLSFMVCWWLRNRNAPLFNWPLLGHFPHLAANLHQFHQWTLKIAERCNGTFVFKGPFLMNMDMMCTIDPLNIQHIMNTNFTNYPKGPDFKEKFDFLGDGIFNVDSDAWRYQRKTGISVINRNGFHRLLMNTISEKVENRLFPLIEHICENGLQVDLMDFIHKFTIDTIYTMLTGYDPKCLNKEYSKQVEYFLAMNDVEEAIFYRNVRPRFLWKFQRWLGFGQEKNMRIGSEILDRNVIAFITRKRAESMKGEDKESVDLLRKFLDEKEIQGPKFTNKFLKDIILNFVFAGREFSLTWLLWHVDKNPQVKSKIREELHSISPTKRGRFFEWEKLNQLVYLQAVIYETLRLYPPVMYELKEAVKGDHLPSGHFVEEKMKIFIPLYVMGRSKSIWGEDSEAFKPERWISEEGKLIQYTPYKFMTFSAGPRTCMGKEIALLQMKAIASFIIHNYECEVIDGHPIIPNHDSIILHMKYGFMVKIYKRSST